MQAPTVFTIWPSTQKGNVYETSFLFNANLPANTFTSYAWDFGDGSTVYDVASAYHTYTYPGIFTVSMSAWTDTGVLLSDSATIETDYAIRDLIGITHVPSSYNFAGVIPTDVFTISITSSKLEPTLNVILQANGSKSIPHDSIEDKKWKFLIPQWKFIDSITKKTLASNVLSINTSPIYKNGAIVAVSGVGSFYYFDDSATDHTIANPLPLTIIATLSTQGLNYLAETSFYPYFSYANNETVNASVKWRTNNVLPEKLKVTENGLSDVYPIKWSGVPIPVMITCEGNTSSVGVFPNSPFSILSYPKSNSIGLAHQVYVTLSSAGGIIPNNQYTIEVDGVTLPSSTAQLYFKERDSNNNLSTGFIFTTVTPLSPIAGDVVISVNTIVTDGVNTSSANGQSKPFKVLDLQTGAPKITKVNEEFDTAKYLKSLALPENMQNNTEFFDVLLKAIVGDGNPNEESMGRIVYERIANFVQTHGDFQTSEIQQLFSFAQQLSVEYKQFGVNFPREIARLIDLFSVNKHYLRGTLKYDKDLYTTIGDLITTSSLVSAGMEIFMKDKLHNTYQKVYLSPLDSGALVYPLSSIDVDDARIPIIDNYLFFYSIQTSLGYENNIINWDSAFTTLSYSLSTNEEWYGENGLVELSFNNLLTKQLFS